MANENWPRLGFGIGLRAEHYDAIAGDRPPVDWFEAITENYVETGGRPLAILETIRRDYPVALHGVALSIGSADGIDHDYLRRLSGLVERIEPALVTDHLSWSRCSGRSTFDLLPLPYTDEALDIVVRNVCDAQDHLGRRILLENPSTYIAWAHSTIHEADFLAAVAERADCGILLDVNNVHVSATNLAFDPDEYIDRIPADRIGQIHLAGFTDMGSYLFDTHGAPVADAVWRLYRRVIARCGPVATLIEWDADIPPLDRVCAEAEAARQNCEAILRKRAMHERP
jgi:uncharacterized protein (UPF0276 family)